VPGVQNGGILDKRVRGDTSGMVCTKDGKLIRGCSRTISLCVTHIRINPIDPRELQKLQPGIRHAEGRLLMMRDTHRWSGGNCPAAHG